MTEQLWSIYRICVGKKKMMWWRSTTTYIGYQHLKGKNRARQLDVPGALNICLTFSVIIMIVQVTNRFGLSEWDGKGDGTTIVSPTHTFLQLFWI